MSIFKIKGDTGNNFIHVADDGHVVQPGYTEVVGATNGDDWIGGERGSDIIFGGDGNDTIVGAHGSNTLYGESGDDVLIGGSHNKDFDRLYGGAGDDMLYGGVGSDAMYGGAGADTFVYLSTRDGTHGPRHHDKIFDFSHAEGDKIDLSRIDADPFTAGDQAFHFVDHRTSEVGAVWLRGDGGVRANGLKFYVTADVHLTAEDFIF